MIFPEETGNMEVLYPGNLALLSMFLKNPDQAGLDKDAKKECADVLTCGSCQKDFLLADILRFIQHKIHCQANPLDLRGSSDGADDENTTDNSTPKKEGDSDILERSGERTPPSSPVKNDNYGRNNKSDEKRKREEDEDSPLTSTARKKVKTVQDAEAMTVDSEPARYVCGTCSSVLSSAWSLVQHVQLSHGIIIYQESSKIPRTISSPKTPPGVPKPSHSSPLSSVSSTATTASLPMSHLPLPLLDPTKIDLRKMVTPATSSAALPHHPSPLLDPTHPLNLLRMPLTDGRVPFHPGLAPPFMRPGHDFRMDQFIQEGLRLSSGLLPSAFDRPPFLDPGLGAPRPSAPRPLSAGGDPNLDFYSQRLRQLAGATSPTSSTSPKKSSLNLPSPFSSPTAPTPSVSAPPQTPTSTRQDSINSIVKPFKCEQCYKSFKWESNLVIHCRSHTEEENFSCLRCQEVLTTVNAVRLHMKTHKKTSSQNGTSPDSSRPQTDEDPEENEETEDEENADLSITDSDIEAEIDISRSETAEDGPEDLSTSKSSKNDSLTSQNVSSSTTSEKPKSVVGELMDKFGLSNISAYSEAYQQALKESGRYLHLFENDNRNNANKVGTEKSIKLRNDLTRKNIVASQPSLDLAHQSLLGAFDNPYDIGKRINSAPIENSAGLYAGLWLPSLSTPGSSPRDIFPGMSHAESNYLNRKLEIPLKSPSNGLVRPKSNSSSTPLSMASRRSERGRNDTCEYCGKIFKNCSNLTVHRRSHTGEKPYKCDLCSYACAQSSKLTRHQKTHGRVGKDVYRCRFCDMPFSVASTLEKHMRKCVVNQSNKGMFSPISSHSQDGMNLSAAYKGFQLPSVISNETKSKNDKFTSLSSAKLDDLDSNYKGYMKSVLAEETAKSLNHTKSLFTPITVPKLENLHDATYKGFHMTSVISDDTPKNPGLFSSPFNLAAVASVPKITEGERGQSPNMFGAVS